VARAEHFGVAQREREQDRVARRHIGNGDAGLDASGRHRDRRVGERRSADPRKVQLLHVMAGGPERPRQPLRRFEFDGMALPVIHRQAPAFVTLAVGPGERRGGVEPAGQ